MVAPASKGLIPQLVLMSETKLVFARARVKWKISPRLKVDWRMSDEYDPSERLFEKLFEQGVDAVQHRRSP